jgi:hypothetical protein
MAETASQRLGCPIPLDEHAVSVTMPTWANVVGYEEGDPYVHSQLNVGYPRFKLHASVERLTMICLARKKFGALNEAEVPLGHTRYSWTAKMLAGREPRIELVDVPFGHTNFSWNSDMLSGPLHCMVLPSRAVARRFCDFMVQSRPFHNYTFSIILINITYCGTILKNAIDRVEVHIAAVEIPQMELVAAYYPDCAKAKVTANFVDEQLPSIL